ncbi:MAG: RelA/SpoT family protein [Patescibacteria group bacterium]|nr:RelA/SpoT family protein [Patescibacteria group bacterium]
MNFEKFKNKLLAYRAYNDEEIILLEKSFIYGKKAYAGLSRLNGEPHFYHCLRTAINLATLSIDVQTISAGILHDVLEDTKTTKQDLENEFGKEITNLVEGVTKISGYKYKKRDTKQAENLRKLILSIIKDIRVAIIKLADRLDNMRTLHFLPEEKKKRIAIETADIYVPLANRLGISEWAGELDDLSLKNLEPEKYHWLVKRIKQKISAGKIYLENIKFQIENELIKNRVKFKEIQYRVKRPSSVYKKLQRKNFDFNQIYDLLALRIIVEKTEECYLTLGIVHSLFKPLIHEFDDYIAFPKPNGYRGLHTTVIDSNGRILEIQIKTEKMHYQNEYGAAAYFAYAESKNTENYKEEKPIFARAEDVKSVMNLRNWQDGIYEIINERIYVLTPKGDIVDLPAGSTPLDFAYKIHTNLGHHFSGARVNQKIVPIDYRLNNGDLVEIITSKNKRPSRNWLMIVKSSKAKKKIRSFLNKENYLNDSKIESYKINIIASDRVGLLKDITNIISSKKFNIFDSKTKVKKNLAYLSFIIRAKNKEEIFDLKKLLRDKIKEIIEIK